MHTDEVLISSMRACSPAFRPEIPRPEPPVPNDTTWMPHPPRRISSVAGTSTPYGPGGPERRARITSHDSQPGAQQHQEATPGRGAAAHDQLKRTGNTRFRARVTPANCGA